MAIKTGNGYKLLETAGVSENEWKWLYIAGITRYSWKWFQMSGNKPAAQAAGADPSQ